MPPHISEFRRIVRVFFARKTAVFGLVILVGLVVAAIFSAQLAPYDPFATNYDECLQQPSWKHLLGTDVIGRDILSRIIYGSRISLIIGVVATTVGNLFGMTLGLIAGYFGGKTYTVIMRLVDAWMAIPRIVLFLVVAAALGGGLRNLTIALAAGMISGGARLMCGQVLAVKQQDYIMAAHASGASNLRIMLQHIVPNAFPPILVLITISMGMCILAEASLSFLGLGIPPPTPAWGGMVNDGYKHLLRNPVLSFAPGVAIMLVVFAFNMMGDGLRDAVDPRLRGTV